MNGWCWVWLGDNCEDLALITREYIGLRPLVWPSPGFRDTAWMIQEWVVEQLLETYGKEDV